MYHCSSQLIFICISIHLAISKAELVRLSGQHGNSGNKCQPKSTIQSSSDGNQKRKAQQRVSHCHCSTAQKNQVFVGAARACPPRCQRNAKAEQLSSMESETLMPTLFCEDLSETQTRKMHKNDPMNSSNRQIWNNHQKTCTYNCQRPTSNSTCLFSALVSFENADSESAEDTQKCSQGRMASTGTSHQMGTPLVV